MPIQIPEPSKSEAAYLALKHAVIEQALSPGTKLPEDVLATHLKVSRTLVREALARLMSEGLVASSRKRTATVAQPSRAEAQSVFEARACLEQEVVRRVMTRWTPAMGAELTGHVRTEEEAARIQAPPVCARLAGEFHIRLAAMSGNPVIERYVSELVSRCSLILAIYGNPHHSQCGIDEHKALIDAFRRQDEKAALRLMASHLDNVQERALMPERKPVDEDLGGILSRYVSPEGATTSTGRARKGARSRA
ncbi:GntR family transcriptional regulator [Variovorax dokdonensis]|uniref:GntR family transcriptional regulator n=1 Tax=Variovorax dokdonensis TaxID=344883 RepID=A0ABT7N5A4_9BURK|nr:GntR family transcriptional regulator [Variovorax dokdonensis]MDM0043129.1 GntR family transcriptional regulator [Variovorax dokdonensis]